MFWAASDVPLQPIRTACSLSSMYTGSPSSTTFDDAATADENGSLGPNQSSNLSLGVNAVGIQTLDRISMSVENTDLHPVHELSISQSDLYSPRERETVPSSPRLGLSSLVPGQSERSAFSSVSPRRIHESDQSAFRRTEEDVSKIEVKHSVYESRMRDRISRLLRNEEELERKVFSRFYFCTFRSSSSENPFQYVSYCNVLSVLVMICPFC